MWFMFSSVVIKEEEEGAREWFVLDESRVVCQKEAHVSFNLDVMA